MCGGPGVPLRQRPERFQSEGYFLTGASWPIGGRAAS